VCSATADATGDVVVVAMINLYTVETCDDLETSTRRVRCDSTVCSFEDISNAFIIPHVLLRWLTASTFKICCTTHAVVCSSTAAHCVPTLALMTQY
jgi:hypothetical protein